MMGGGRVVRDLVAEALEELRVLVGPTLVGAQSLIVDADIRDGDDCMAADDLLQFALLNDEPLPDPLLRRIEEAVGWGWDDELRERTLGWVKKHRRLALATA